MKYFVIGLIQYDITTTWLFNSFMTEVPIKLVQINGLVFTW